MLAMWCLGDGLETSPVVLLTLLLSTSNGVESCHYSLYMSDVCKVCFCCEHELNSTWIHGISFLKCDYHI